MTKIVYNACFGGFGLSNRAIERFLELKGTNPVPIMDEYGYIEYEGFNLYGVSRTDPHLVQVVEEMGKAANGPSADLQIRDLPAGTKYRIDEYDGSESVITIAEYEWSVA